MRQRGFSLFEFAIVAAVFALLLGVALGRMGWYQQAGEQASLQAIQINLRAALSAQVMALQAQGREADVAGLAGANPVLWLERPPSTYAGVLSATQAQVLPAGSWYFSQEAQLLVYVLAEQETSLNSAARNICFRVELQRLPPKTANAARQPVNHAGVEFKEVTECRIAPPAKAAHR